VLLIVLPVPRVARQSVHAPLAIVLSRRGAECTDGGSGSWEVARRRSSPRTARIAGSTSYRADRAGWLVQTAWTWRTPPDAPDARWLPRRPLECAVTDALLALWLFAARPT
jgi:hypothetical protein